MLAFEQDAFIRQKLEVSRGRDAPPPPDATALARAFRSACAALTPYVWAGFVQATPPRDLLRRFAEQEDDVVDLDGDALLDRGFGLVYLTNGMATVRTPDGDELPIEGGRLIFSGSGDQRW